MTHICQDDGIEYLDHGERYRVTGYVRVLVRVDFTTFSEPHEDGFLQDLHDEVVMMDDWEIDEDSIDDLTLSVEAV